MKIQRGFTLIEVMVVVVIIAILAAVAYPSYRDYVIRANRNAAQSFMLEVASRQERYLLDARQYATAIGTGGTELNITIPPTVSKNYTIATLGVAGPPPAYTVTATPIGSQLADDGKCGALTIDQTSAKSISGSGTVAQCWQQ